MGAKGVQGGAGVKLFIDFETRSRVDLKKVGAWAYAMHPSTEILCLGIGNEAGVAVLSAEDLRASAAFDFNGAIVSAHNAHFEYAIYGCILHRRYGWPALWDPKRWRCTMARAAVCGLPLDLDSLGRVLEIKTPKDLDGRRVMMQLCKPQKDGAFDNDPEKLKRLYAYNAVDVRAEMEVNALLPELSPFERSVWEMDLAINRRGVQIDLDFARKAAKLSDQLVTGLNTRLEALTNGAVDKATRVSALKYYLADKHGLATESLDKEGVTTLMADPLLDDTARGVLSLRRQVGKKNSVAKYTAAAEMACPDGRCRGLLQYSAAHTRRWGGRGLQPQNFPKGFGEKDQALAINAVKLNAEEFEGYYGDKAMDALSNSLRGLFIAAPGKELACADFNAIEARVLFWLAGEEAALAAYRKGESPYVDLARYIYKNPKITKATHPQEYDIGKRSVLGAGYGMGPDKFRATVYTETAKTGKPVVISDALAQLAIGGYREKYANVPRTWREMERAAILAVKDPTRAQPCCGGRVLWGMTKDRRFLACRLPSGEHLRYWRPSVRPTKTPWGETRDALHYWGLNEVKQWAMLNTYGGALTENVVQATARDLLAAGMLNVQASGKYDVVLTCHDEVLAEAPAGAADLKEFIGLLCATPPWAAGCPVAAEGFISRRYRK